MIEPTYGIFVPGDVIRQRLRVICEKTGCSANEAIGAIVMIWLFGASIAEDSNGDISVLYNVVKSTLSDSISTGQMVAAMYEAGLIERHDDGVFRIVDAQEVFEPSKRLEEFDQKLEKKRYLDMIRKQKRRAELKEAEKVESTPPKAEQIPPKAEQTAVLEPEKPPEPDQKPEKPPKPKPEKKHYGEFVLMTEAEYQKLVNEYGQETADEMVKVLDNYKGSKGKTYKSDYRAILMWVVNYIKEHSPQLLQKTQQAQWHDDNPF